MKRTISITVEIDPCDYHDAKDTPAGAIAVAIACLSNEADWHATLIVACDEQRKEISL